MSGAPFESAQTGATYTHNQEEYRTTGEPPTACTCGPALRRILPCGASCPVASCVSPTWVGGRVRRPGPSVVLDLPPTRRRRLAALPPSLQSVPSLWSPLLTCPGPGHGRPAAAARPLHPFPIRSIRGPLGSGKSIQAWRNNRESTIERTCMTHFVFARNIYLAESRTLAASNEGQEQVSICSSVGPSAAGDNSWKKNPHVR